LATPSRWHATSPDVSESVLEVEGSRHPPDSPPRDVVLELKLLPSTGVIRLQRYYEPLRHPIRPGLSLAGIRVEGATLRPIGLPLLRSLPVCLHAVAMTPADLLGPSLVPPAAAAFPHIQRGRLPPHLFRGLLSVHSRDGLPARRVASGDPLHQRLRRVRGLPRRSDCYRLERQLPGGTHTRWGRAPFHGALNIAARSAECYDYGE
jgi:hypothetical protein